MKIKYAFLSLIFSLLLLIPYSFNSADRAIVNAIETIQIEDNDGFIRFLNQNPNNINAECHNRYLIWWAIDSGNLDVAELLIMRGADVNLCSPDGVTVFSAIFNKLLLKTLSEDQAIDFLRLFINNRADLRSIFFDQSINLDGILKKESVAKFLIEETSFLELVKSLENDEPKKYQEIISILQKINLHRILKSFISNFKNISIDFYLKTHFIGSTFGLIKDIESKSLPSVVIEKKYSHIRNCFKELSKLSKEKIIDVRQIDGTLKNCLNQLRLIN